MTNQAIYQSEQFQTSINYIAVDIINFLVQLPLVVSYWFIITDSIVYHNYSKLKINYSSISLNPDLHPP